VGEVSPSLRPGVPPVLRRFPPFLLGGRIPLLGAPQVGEVTRINFGWGAPTSVGCADVDAAVIFNVTARVFPKEKKMPAIPKPDPREIILRHLARYGVRDKDAVAAASAKGKKTREGRTRNGRRALDLHGLTVDAAIATLRDEIDRCASHGVAELLVIHGYGLHSKPGEGGTLKTAVKQYLEEISDAGRYGAIFRRYQKRAAKARRW